jgi:pimeloyl-ACP methyl ester carboxylesterase
VLEALDALGLAQYDLYGAHTGANMAVEMAIARPQRIRHLILDGIALYSPELRRHMLAHYAKPMPPRSDGAHLLQAWHFVRDQWIFWPWFRREAAHRRAIDLAAPEFLHEVALDVLKSPTTYQRAYRASFSYKKEKRLPLLRVPTLVTSPENDIFFPELEQIVALVPGCRHAALPGIGTLDASAELFTRFLDEG